MENKRERHNDEEAKRAFTRIIVLPNVHVLLLAYIYVYIYACRVYDTNINIYIHMGTSPKHHCVLQAWFQTASYKFRRMWWTEPHQQDCLLGIGFSELSQTLHLDRLNPQHIYRERFNIIKCSFKIF